MTSLIQRAKQYPTQKELGQNFLVDENKLDDIVAAANLDAEQDYVLEIGPGIGFLTERLVKKTKLLRAVELDANAVLNLDILKANHANFDYFRKDILSLNIDEIFPDLDRKVKIVANIPYQITTRILLHFLGEMALENPNRPHVSEINIMVQKEFAQRLIANPGTKSYGAITLLIRYWADVEICVDVPSECFWPAPKVDSAFIKIKVRDENKYQCQKPKQLRRMIKAIFANRRKKMKNGLKAAGYQDREIELLELSENLRGESLELAELIELSDRLG